MKGMILTKFQLDKLPDYTELSIRRLSEEEIEAYRGKLECINGWEDDLREMIIVNYGSWYLVKWA